ncbi:MAG: PDZ domain-containing protein [Planctomycetes bacterium]|nr:PDZ domain-containing protein [Planctomycetota bacterium]
MRRWQTCLAMGFVSVSISSSAHAQSLLERVQQALTPEIPPAATAEAGELPPEVVVPEALPVPQPTPRAFTGRPTLGVTVDPLTDDIVRQRRLPVRSGAIITAIVQGAPADRAGLPLGAVIVALDGRRIDSPADLVAEIRAAPTDRPVELSYYDGDRLYRKRVQLLETSAIRNAPAAPGPVRRDPQPLSRGPSLEEQLGGQGQRPVLGRFGQLLDGLVAPVTGAAPLGQPNSVASETALLREQVSLLQQELNVVRARLAAVEKQLESRREQ